MFTLCHCTVPGTQKGVRRPLLTELRRLCKGTGMEAKHGTGGNLSAGAADWWGLGGKAGAGCTWFESPLHCLLVA